MPAGPALLSLKTDALLITAFVSYTETGIHIDFNEVALPVNGSDEEKTKQIVQRMAQLFEDGISEHPEDWHMLQRIWIDGDFVERT
jgi:KDO2-lipid IV(A) lauroyltransferase